MRKKKVKPVEAGNRLLTLTEAAEGFLKLYHECTAGLEDDAKVQFLHVLSLSLGGPGVVGGRP